MKRSTKSFITIIAIFIGLTSFIYGLIWYQNQPSQYILTNFGIQMPSGVKLESFYTEPDWDGHLCYGVLSKQESIDNGIINTSNYLPLSGSQDSRINQLIQDVNKSFSISMATIDSPSLRYEKIAIKGTSLMVIFYDSQTKDYFFYGTRY